MINPIHGKLLQAWEVWEKHYTVGSDKKKRKVRGGLLVSDVMIINGYTWLHKACDSILDDFQNLWNFLP